MIGPTLKGFDQHPRTVQEKLELAIFALESIRDSIGYLALSADSSLIYAKTIATRVILRIR